MKKVLSVLLTLAMIATFVGCGAKEEPAAPAAAETQEQAPAENAEEAAPVEEEQEAAPAEETYEPVTLHVVYAQLRKLMVSTYCKRKRLFRRSRHYSRNGRVCRRSYHHCSNGIRKY